MYQPLGQVTQVERDAHLKTVDGQYSGTTVMRKLSKGHPIKKKDNQNELSKATKSTVLPVQRHKTQDDHKHITRVTQMNTLNEVEDEDAAAEYDDQMPQLFSQSSINRQNIQKDEITSIISSTPDRPSGPLLEETNYK